MKCFSYGGLACIGTVLGTVLGAVTRCVTLGAGMLCDGMLCDAV